jgi:hypothetical protein
MLSVTLGTVLLAWTRFGQALSEAVPLAAIVGYQAFRFPLELVLHRLYTEGVIPEQMTYTGQNFDIATGITAVAVAGAIFVGRCPRWLVGLWNIAGLALLLNIVAVYRRRDRKLGEENSKVHKRAARALNAGARPPFCFRHQEACGA